MNGVDDTMMSQFSGVLTDAEIAAVITFQRNAFGNKTGDTLQPAHIRSLRDVAKVMSETPDNVASAADSISTDGVN